MSYRYRVTTDAERDIIAAEDYVASYAGADEVDRMDDAFLAAFAALCENPFLYPVYQFSPPIETLHEYRSVNVGRFKVFYWVDGDDVEIYRVCHLVSDFTRRRF